MTDIATPTTQIRPGHWGIDTAHSTVEFTVRHLANVFQGLLMSSPDVVNT